jgi:hypothetical protein
MKSRGILAVFNIFNGVFNNSQGKGVENPGKRWEKPAFFVEKLSTGDFSHSTSS